MALLSCCKCSIKYTQYTLQRILSEKEHNQSKITVLRRLLEYTFFYRAEGFDLLIRNKGILKEPAIKTWSYVCTVNIDITASHSGGTPNFSVLPHDNSDPFFSTL